MYLFSDYTTLRIAKKKKRKNKRPKKETGLKPRSKKRRKIPDRERRELQATHLARAIQVLKLVLSEDIHDAGKMAEKLGVTERTVYRDIRALKKAGIPIIFDEGTKGYRVPFGFNFQTSPTHLL